MTHKLVPLEPCPFCGGTKILEDFVPNTGGNVKFMWCQTCNAHGPWFDRNVLPPPKFQWNRRAAAPSPPAQDAQDALIERLRYIAATDDARFSGIDVTLVEAADRLAAQAGEIADLKATLAAEVKTSSHLAKAIEELRAELAAARESSHKVATDMKHWTDTKPDEWKVKEWIYILSGERI